ncbi:hypothetical protein MHYP_G00063740 [Metynnis hypsauchen]
MAFSCKRPRVSSNLGVRKHFLFKSTWPYRIFVESGGAESARPGTLVDERLPGLILELNVSARAPTCAR